MYKHRKRRRKMGLGSLKLIDLEQSRARNIEARRDLLNGIDPLALRAKRRAKTASAKPVPRHSGKQHAPIPPTTRPNGEIPSTWLNTT